MKNYRQFHIGVGFVTIGAILVAGAFHAETWFATVACLTTSYIQFSIGLDSILWAKD